MKVRMFQELESNAPRCAVKMFLHKVKKVQREWRIFRRWQKKVCAQRIDEFIHAEQATIKAWYKKKEEVLNSPCQSARHFVSGAEIS